MKQKKTFAITMALTTLLTSTQNTSCAGKFNLTTPGHGLLSTSSPEYDYTRVTSELGTNSDKSSSSSSQHDRMEANPHPSASNTSARTLDPKQDKEEDKTLDSYASHLNGKTMTKLPTTEDRCVSQDKPNTSATANASSTNNTSKAATTTSKPDQRDKLVDEIELLLSKSNSKELRKFLTDNEVLVKDSLDKKTLKSKLQNQSINLEELALVVIKTQTLTSSNRPLLRSRNEVEDHTGTELENDTDSETEPEEEILDAGTIPSDSPNRDQTKDTNQDIIYTNVSSPSISPTTDDISPCPNKKARLEPPIDNIESLSTQPEVEERLASSESDLMCVQVYPGTESIDTSKLIDDRANSKENIIEIRKQMPDRTIIAVCPKNSPIHFATIKHTLIDKYNTVPHSELNKKPIIYFGLNVHFNKNSFTDSLGKTEINADIIIYESSFAQNAVHHNVIHGMCILLRPMMSSKECFHLNQTDNGLFIVGNGYGPTSSGGHYAIFQEKNVFYLSGTGLISNMRKAKLPPPLNAKFSDPSKVNFSVILATAITNANPETRQIEPSDIFVNRHILKISPLQQSPEKYVTIYDPKNAESYNPDDRNNLKEISTQMFGRTIIAICTPCGITDTFHVTDVIETFKQAYLHHKNPIIYFGNHVHFRQKAFNPQSLGLKKINADIIICGSSFSYYAFSCNKIHGMCLLFNPIMKTKQSFSQNEFHNGLFVVGTNEKEQSGFPISAYSNTYYLSGKGLLPLSYQTITIPTADFRTALSKALDPSSGATQIPDKSTPASEDPRDCERTLAPIPFPFLDAVIPHGTTPADPFVIIPPISSTPSSKQQSLYSKTSSPPIGCSTFVPFTPNDTEKTTDTSMSDASPNPETFIAAQNQQSDETYHISPLTIFPNIIPDTSMTDDKQ